MNTVISAYSPIFVMRSQDPSTLRIIDIWSFKSLKSNKRYIVEVEYFSMNFLGLKFYWKGVANSPDRYSYLTNDYEPRIIVMTCISIMLKYYHSDHLISFGFVAADDLNMPRVKGEPNKRFRFYRRMMLTVFGEQTFVQAYDLENSVYLLINRTMFEDGKITINEIEKEISRLYEGDYSLILENRGFM